MRLKKYGSRSAAAPPDAEQGGIGRADCCFALWCLLEGFGAGDGEGFSGRIRQSGEEIGRAHVCTPVTNAHLVCRLLLEKKSLILTTLFHVGTGNRYRPATTCTQ